MADRDILKKNFNESNLKAFIQNGMKQFSDLVDEEVNDSILLYSIEWFKSYLENDVGLDDYKNEIKQLNNDKYTQNMVKLIEKAIEDLGKTEEQKGKNHENVVETNQQQQSIHDKIQRKDKNTNKPPVVPNVEDVNKKKELKIKEKEDQKLQKLNQQINSVIKDDADKDLLNELEKKKKQRCRYFPNCKNEKTCPYIHPTTECTYFPKCTYGSSCINLHPQCKYGKTCTRPDCFYDHPPGAKTKNMNPVLSLFNFMQMIGGTNKQRPSTIKIKQAQKPKTNQTNEETQKIVEETS